jgi:hypothetical protein
MPSYRITLGVGALRAGTDPQSVLPTAAAAARELTTVEAWDLAVVRGEARMRSPQLTRRWGARWYPLR